METKEQSRALYTCMTLSRFPSLAPRENQELLVRACGAENRSSTDDVITAPTEVIVDDVLVDIKTAAVKVELFTTLLL